MYKNKLSIDKIDRRIKELRLANSLKTTRKYDMKFRSHLTDLLSFYLATPSQQEDRRIKFDERTYTGLEQYVLENSSVLEHDEQADEIDWNLIDDAKDILEHKLKELLGTEGKSDYLRPFLDCTIDFYENWLIYDLMHPGSVFNPWRQTLDILENGYICFVSDKREQLTEYKKNIYEKAEKEAYGNLGFIVKSQKKKEKNYSGFLVDNRYDIQLSVHDYLKKDGSGRKKSKSLKNIQYFLHSNGMGANKITDTAWNLRKKVIIPLKRTELVGSWGNGYFYIATGEDLRQAYKNHIEKLRGLDKTLAIYKKRAKEFGINLTEEDIKSAHLGNQQLTEKADGESNFNRAAV